MPLLSSRTSLLPRMQDRGVEHMTLDFTASHLTDTKATTGCHVRSLEDTTFPTAQATLIEASSLHVTADDGLPSGNPCGSSMCRKNQLVGDLSVQATKGSMEASPTGSKNGYDISPEQLRLTTAISKGM